MRARGLKRTTCNSRIRTVSAFYTWCRRMNLIDQLPFDRSEMLVKKPTGFLAYVDASGNSQSPSTQCFPKCVECGQRDLISMRRVADHEVHGCVSEGLDDGTRERRHLIF